LSVLGLTALTDLFLVTAHSPKTRLTSQQPALLIRPATNSSPVDVGYYINTPIKPGVVKEVRQAINLNDKAYTCGKMADIPTTMFTCSCMLCLKNHIDFTQFVDNHYMI
jgi:hypothetical protein